MLRTNSANRVSPSEQMYALNRINGLGGTSTGIPGLGAINIDPLSAIVSGVATLFGKLAGTFTKDPNRDIHIPAQDACVQAYQDVLNQVESQRVQGTLTQDSLNRAVYAIRVIYQNFTTLTNNLAKQYPANASRYIAGQREVTALGQRLITDLNAKFAGQLSATPSLSDIASKIGNFFSPAGGGISQMLLLSAAFFIVPKLLKR